MMLNVIEVSEKLKYVEEPFICVILLIDLC